MHRLLLVLLSAALCIVWVACSKDKEQEEESTEESAAESPEESAAESPEESPEESAEESNVTVDEYGITTTQWQLNEPMPMPNDFEAIILSVERVETTGAIVADTELYLSRPMDGFTFVVVTYSLENKGAEARNGTHSLIFGDGSNEQMGVNTSATANYVTHQLSPGQEASHGEIQPGETRLKATVFEVPVESWDAGGCRMRYEAGGWGDTRPTLYEFSVN